MQSIEATISLIFLLVFIMGFANTPIDYKINGEIVYAQLNDYYNVLELRNSQFEFYPQNALAIEQDLSKMEELSSKCIGLESSYLNKQCESKGERFSAERFSKLAFLEAKTAVFIS